MKQLVASQYVTLSIDEAETNRFESFLDRNFSDWRTRQMFAAKNANTIKRRWAVGIDDVERCAIYRIDYVEIYDEHYDLDGDDEATFNLLKHLICDINGDLTPVAVWAKSPA